MKEKATSAGLLNEREQEILKHLAAGSSDQQIADELFLSLNTVKWYNRQIYSKLGVGSRTQAIARVKDFGLTGRSNNAAIETLPVPRYHLPAHPPLFIGRSQEMAEVKQLLHVSSLLTLTGTGGIGKTQLALRVAAEVAGSFVDGVCFVDLAPLSDHTLVAKAIAGALDVFEQPADPLPETLKRVLVQRELLLLLDNFEHVIKAAPLISQLLEASSHLKVLVTSREPLRLAMEQEYQVPPLSLPDPVSMPLVEESLALFRELIHQPGIAQALNIIGEIARLSGDDDYARHAYEQCLAVSQQTGETRRIIFMYNNLTFIALHDGEAEHARDLGRQGLQLAREMNNRLQMATDLALLAGSICALGDARQAARLLGASERTLERLGAFHQLNDKPEIDAIITAVRAQLDETNFLATWAQGRELTLEQAMAEALDV